MKIRAKSHRAIIAVMAACLLLPQTLWAERKATIDESPHAGLMAADLVVARPVSLLVTAAGTAAFIVSLPFTLLAGNASDAAEQLMIGPAKNTFVRCLGCTNAGYSYRDIDKNTARKERIAEQDAAAKAVSSE
jgi:hypothetical protein